MEAVQLRNPRRQLKKLDEDSLTKQPEEVFDVLEKLGEGSYGSVFKAIHKETGQIVAIKQVPVESDLQEIIKEISIMQQCDSPHVVKYYGSYFKNTDLWIVMEYCGAGSVSDIIRLRNKTDTMAKRNTVIGTPFWMAPEVIQEIGYNCVADIWSLGITAIEMAEGKPPYADIHPMRAIFMIPTNPPPTFRKPELWSDSFTDFVKQCLVKSPEQRATATQLLQHPFVKSAKGVSILRDLINEAMDIKLKRQEAQQRELDQDDEENSEEDETDSGTMVRASGDETGTIRAVNTMTDGANTMIEHDGTLESQLGTMVINTEEEEEEGTMKRRDETMQPAKPSFLEYFEQKEKENQINSFGKNVSGQTKNSSDWKVPQDGDYEFLKTWSVDELQRRLSALDPMMEQEIEEIRQKYQSKRQPILDAIEAKKRRQQNF
ncbi:serine/threonine-protein kinase 4 isoform 3-T3 [Amazona ochrocephala]|uniref:non-specific serine/threonine protein kinase n=1 Tax=Amazona collaria TaxID=241587 RepID=A0A8B9F732_9PSIT